MNEIFEMKEYAKENSVPILKDGTRDFIIEYIKMHNIKKILEIGSAIGYSAISFARTSPDISVDTIEYDFERYQTAFKNVQNHNLADRITVYLGDAADFTTDEKYDLIFIDGPKAQNLKFFMKFSNNLSENGVIITDNLSFHGMVEDENLTHNYSTKKMVRKIRRYVTFLKENPEFTTEFFPVGDTISVSKKNKNPDFSLYLENTPIVDYSSSEVQAVCAQFEQFRDNQILLAEKAFYFVQNHFPHTSDCKRTELSISASDVIKNGHGLCFAKSHLYAAILRNFGIPCGFCYQILCAKEKNHFYPHSLNAVYFKTLNKWIHLDARGNKPGQNAKFSIDKEFLAYTPNPLKKEVMLPMIYTNPFKGAIDCMKKCKDKPEFFKHLNDLSESMRAYYQIM
ncbi:MAG: transglutaminase domain-containing protein [Treponema sp.]|nr:transglutaminase domain-containing protein [Treponema sp.]